MKKLHLKHLWFVFAAYGVWFAIFSGSEELMRGKWWKFVLSLLLGAVAYFIIETRSKK